MTDGKIQIYGGKALISDEGKVATADECCCPGDICVDGVDGATGVENTTDYDMLLDLGSGFSGLSNCPWSDLNDQFTLVWAVGSAWTYTDLNWCSNIYYSGYPVYCDVSSAVSLYLHANLSCVDDNTLLVLAEIDFVCGGYSFGFAWCDHVTNVATSWELPGSTESQCGYGVPDCPNFCPATLTGSSDPVNLSMIIP